MSEKKGLDFNIIKNDPPDDHKGTNTGSISPNNIAPVFIDIENQKVFVDIGDMRIHAEVEKSVERITNKS